MVKKLLARDFQYLLGHSGLQDVATWVEILGHGHIGGQFSVAYLHVSDCLNELRTEHGIPLDAFVHYESGRNDAKAYRDRRNDEQASQRKPTQQVELLRGCFSIQHRCLPDIRHSHKDFLSARHPATYFFAFE